MAKTIKMKHADTGKEADVHPDMEADYKAGGYVPIKKPTRKTKSE